MKVGIVGGGAAGFFASIWVRKNHPNSQVTILEKSNKVLSKVRISGGGRCNVTNAEPSLSTLTRAYPRGSKLLKKGFREFNNRDFMSWLENEGVELKTEAHGHVFPISNSSQTIIDCLSGRAEKLGVRVEKNRPVLEIKPGPSGLTLRSKSEDLKFDKLIVACGGSPKKQGLDWLEALGHRIIPPAPSLFTFNIPGDPIIALQGLSTKNTRVRIQASKLMYEGPALVTHWGMSGPAVLKLSAFGARYLHDLDYHFGIQVHWDARLSYEETLDLLLESSDSKRMKSIGNFNPIDVPNRLWLHLIDKSGLDSRKPWGELGKKGINKLANTLCNDRYQVQGKTTFKEEFVTAGGISLESINPRTMESLAVPGLYFAGEILDIDGITGGYNFQAAWTTAFLAAKLL